MMIVGRFVVKNKHFYRFIFILWSVDYWSMIKTMIFFENKKHRQAVNI
ncbi:hypothetical protein L313_0036 [Acinetobacter haemolyticus CIP 64.3 = MTCC 9819]|nr:hypothetical protein HMPREF0023_2242 [Acinetobacter sp. ATCC 27244]EPR90660.1 hypothetical protein L313_0036 [Acinetobacter haemolyticus CIP 64.3 = MTCC 9819]